MMASFFAALALLSGTIGAGFASGREILRFFAVHGSAAFAAAALALMTLALLFVRLCAQMESASCTTLDALCRVRFGNRLGRLCGALFLLLCALTGGAMLAACAELGALMLPIRHAYALTMAFSLLLGVLLAHSGMQGLALPGLALACLIPVLMLRLAFAGSGEACFLPAMAPDQPIRAAADGVAYGALNAAMLAGALPMLLSLSAKQRRRAVLLFCALFGALLLLGVFVCRRHFAAIRMQPLPFVHLSRSLGRGGQALVAACMYAAALSTLCAMLSGVSRLLPRFGLPAGALLCLFFAGIGFGPLISSGYPTLGALCAGLLLLLCLPVCQKDSPSAR